MSSILVIDTPESCETCPLRYYDNLQLKCSALRKDVLDIECPLIMFPMKRRNMTYWVQETEYVNPFDTIICHDISDYDKGWNACVEYLEGREQ